MQSSPCASCANVREALATILDHNLTVDGVGEDGLSVEVQMVVWHQRLPHRRSYNLCRIAKECKGMGGSWSDLVGDEGDTVV